MKGLRIAAFLVLAAVATGCNRWDEYPYPPAYSQPSYQQPVYQQPYYSQPCPPSYQSSGTTYVQPSASPCGPATIRQPATR